MNLKNILQDSLPTYITTLPYSKIKTKFRPFLVKEEKKLLILEETSNKKEIYNGIVEVISSCYDNIDFSKIPIFEVEYCFLKLRAKSVGEIITPKITCPITKENHIVQIDLNKLELNIPKQDSVITIGNNLKIKLRYPTVNDISELSTNINDLIANCIVYFETSDEKAETANFSKEEIIDFLDHLTVENYQKILEFFENMPSSPITVNYTTQDGVQRSLVLKNLKDFFS
jgi:predicted DNA-binding protein YlxM (UPF0122 family)